MSEESLPMEALRGFASRLTGIVAGSVHGPAGFAIGKSVEMGARGIRNANQFKRVDNLADFIASGPKVKPPIDARKAKAGISSTSNVMQRMKENKK